MISQKRYVNIVSGVGAGGTVADRKLSLRIMTKNAALTPGVIAEFTGPDLVGQFFGQNSEEYRRAARYFGFLNKQIQAPSSLSFARWVNSAIPSMLVGDSVPKSIASFTPITAGNLTVNIGATTHKFIGLNFSAAADLTEVAVTLQTAIVLEPEFAGVTVTYSSNTRAFTLTSPGAGASSAVVSVTPTDDPQDIYQLLGWGTPGSVVVQGQEADQPDVAVAKSANISNNMGSFVFTNGDGNLTNEQVAKVAEWNATQNVEFMYSVPTSLANMSTLYELVKGFSGTALNVRSSTAANDYVEQCPCEILASINYNQPAANNNFMFYEFPDRNVTVTDDPTANLCDASRANYIGVTQTAGQQLAFYQRGVLCGGPNDPVDMNIYGNEMWLKSALASQFFSLFRAVGAVEASNAGASQLLGVIQPVITLAINNGSITFGKSLSPVQIEYISRVTGDPAAWRQVQTLGYWINVTFQSYVNENSGITEWKAIYRLVYSKGDVIRSVEGSDVLI